MSSSFLRTLWILFFTQWILVSCQWWTKKEIGVDLKLLKNFVFKEIAAEKNQHHWHAERGEEIIDIHLSQMNQAVFMGFIQRKEFSLSILNSDYELPYPGAISRRKNCQNYQSIQKKNHEFMNEKVHIYMLLANRRLALDLCEDTAQYYLLNYIIFCSGSDSVYEIKYYLPKTHKLSAKQHFGADLLPGLCKNVQNK